MVLLIKNHQITTIKAKVANNFLQELDKSVKDSFLEAKKNFSLVIIIINTLNRLKGKDFIR